MEKFQVVSQLDWMSGLKSDARYVCQLPYSVSQTEKEIGIDFTAYEEQGLGQMFSFFMSYKNKRLWLSGFGDKSQTLEPVAIYSYADENDELIVKMVCELFNLEVNQLQEIANK